MMNMNSVFRFLQSDAFKSSIGQKIKICTEVRRSGGRVLVEPNWSQSMAICDAISSDRNDVAEEAYAALLFRMKSCCEADLQDRPANANTCLQLTLLLLDTILQNCRPKATFISQFPQEIVDILASIAKLEKTIDTKNSISAANLIKQMALDDSRGSNGIRFAIPVFSAAYKSMKMNGFLFSDSGSSISASSGMAALPVPPRELSSSSNNSKVAAIATANVPRRPSQPDPTLFSLGGNDEQSTRRHSVATSISSGSSSSSCSSSGSDSEGENDRSLRHSHHNGNLATSVGHHYRHHVEQVDYEHDSTEAAIARLQRDAQKIEELVNSTREMTTSRESACLDSDKACIDDDASANTGTSVDGSASTDDLMAKLSATVDQIHSLPKLHETDADANVNTTDTVGTSAPMEEVISRGSTYSTNRESASDRHSQISEPEPEPYVGIKDDVGSSSNKKRSNSGSSSDGGGNINNVNPPLSLEQPQPQQSHDTDNLRYEKNLILDEEGSGMAITNVQDFRDLDSHLRIVLEKVALCEEMLKEGAKIDSNEAFSELIGFLEVCKTRLHEVVQVGKQGMISTQFLEYTISVNAAVEKVLDLERYSSFKK